MCIVEFAEKATCHSAHSKQGPCHVFPEMSTLSELLFQTYCVSLFPLQGQKGFPGPLGLPGEPVSISVNVCPLMSLIYFSFHQTQTCKKLTFPHKEKVFLVDFKMSFQEKIASVSSFPMLLSTCLPPPAPKS